MNSETSPTPSSLPTRRDFIKKTATASAALAASSWLTPIYGQSQAPSANVRGANDRIAVGIIGVGYGIGKNHLQGIHERAARNNVVVAAACDVFNKRRDWAKERAGLTDADVYLEYERMLERKDVDAVLIASHDPLHRQMCIDAMQAGKHVYCEKPMTRYLEEAFEIYDMAKRTGIVFQLGSQGCTAGAWHRAAELIQGGKIGTLIWGQGYYCRNNPKGEWNYTIEPESTADNIDWKRWLGPVSERPFSADAYHRWRKHYAYCSGLLGDLVPHRLHPLMLATGNPEFPRRVVSIGTRNVHTDRNTPNTPEREVPEHVQLVAEFPSGAMLTLTCSTVNGRSPGFVLYGHKATIEISDQGNGLQLIPERAFSSEFEDLSDSERKALAIDPVRGLQHEDIRAHEQNWFECIRSNKAPNANVDLAVRVQTVIALAEMSERLNVACLFDEKTRQVTTGEGTPIKPITYGSLPLS
jgi:predicted dehydrogenase